MRSLTYAKLHTIKLRDFICLASRVYCQFTYIVIYSVMQLQFSKHLILHICTERRRRRSVHSEYCEWSVPVHHEQ